MMMSRQRTLRRRLTVFYTTVGGAILTTAGVALVTVVFAIGTRPEAVALAQTARDCAAMGAAAPASETTADLERRIVRNQTREDAIVIAIPAEALRESATKAPPGEVSVGAMLGLGRQFVPVRDAGLMVVPRLSRVQSYVRVLLAIVAAVGLSAFVFAWFVARALTRKALEPLLTVTAELRRFANGDFSPRSLDVSDATELGDLAQAYNGAARQVTEAFLERSRVEDQIRQFVADAGHELRTPLTVVAGYVDGLRRGGDDNPQYRRTAFDSLAVEVRRMRLLVERLMTLARLDSRLAQRPEVIAVSAIVDQAVEALTMTSTAEICVRDQRGSLVVGEPGDLYEAVANLIENAIKYGAASPVVVDVRADAGDVAIRVSDAGPGIAESDRVRIFERFYRGAQANAIQGSGLGLAIAAKAAQRLGGRLVLEDSRPGSTTFALHVSAFVDHVSDWSADLGVLDRAR